MYTTAHGSVAVAADGEATGGMRSAPRERSRAEKMASSPVDEPNTTQPSNVAAALTRAPAAAQGRSSDALIVDDHTARTQLLPAKTCTSPSGSGSTHMHWSSESLSTRATLGRVAKIIFGVPLVVGARPSRASAEADDVGSGEGQGRALAVQ